MLRSEFRPNHLLTLLLGGALLLAFGLNVLLLRAQAETWPDDNDTELAATAAELHLTQRLLTQCQGQRQQQDSLLLGRHLPTAPNTATAQAASYSPK